MVDLVIDINSIHSGLVNQVPQILLGMINLFVTFQLGLKYKKLNLIIKSGLTRQASYWLFY